jgi:hypothetical protein
MEEILSMREMQALEIDISLWSVLLTLTIAAACSSAIKYLYSKYGKSLNNRRNFSNIFPMLAITTAMVITVVKFSIALSLGLVGALSIVRFRAAIKEPEELVYLFLVIAIGLGAGANQYLVTIALTIFAILFILLTRKFGSKSKNSGVLMNAIQITCPTGEYRSTMDSAELFMDKNFPEYSFKSLYKQNQNVRINYIIDASVVENSVVFKGLIDNLPGATDISIFHNTPIAE